MFETKEIWRQLWLESINVLTSLKLQKNSCENGVNGDSYHSLVKYVNCYFEIVLHGFDYEFYINDIEWITQEEYEIIKDWHNELHRYVALKPARFSSSILSDMNWLNILCDGWLAKQKLMLILPKFESKILTEITEPNCSPSL